MQHAGTKPKNGKRKSPGEECASGRQRPLHQQSAATSTGKLQRTLTLTESNSISDKRRITVCGSISSQQIVRQQDQNLDILSSGVSRLGERAKNINQEVEEQNR